MRRVMTDLPRDLRSPARARQLTRRALAGWGISADSALGIDAVLCVHEAVANAVVHGQGSIRLTVGLTDDGAVSVRVRDDGPMIPAQRSNPEHGRGMEIITRLAVTFAVIPGLDGKTVAFTMPLPARQEAAA